MIRKKNYKLINDIYGCDKTIIISIIDKNIRDKYSYINNKNIFEIFDKNIKSKYLNTVINIGKLYFIEYFIEIIYHSVNRKYSRIVSALDNIYNLRKKSNDEIYYKDFIFCIGTFINLINYDNIFYKYKENTKMICKISSMLTIFTLLKYENINYSNNATDNKDVKIEEIYNLQNERLVCMGEFIKNDKYIIYRYPKYLIRYIFEKIELLKI